MLPWTILYIWLPQKAEVMILSSFLFLSDSLSELF